VSAPRVVLVDARAGNLFFTELLEGLAAALAGAGAAAEVVRGRFPPLDGDVAYVVVPHEFFGTTPPEDWPDDDQLGRTIALCTEQPGTPWFEHAHDHARRCGVALDIHPAGVAELRRRGVRAERLRLGHLPAWDVWRRDETVPRPVDVLFLGSLNRHRDRLLAGYAPTLWPRRADLVITTHEPKTAPGPDFLVGAAKRERLLRAQLVLSPRRQLSPYFEWLRAVEAICAGCVLVTDHPAGHAPLVAGEHLVAGAPESLALLADGALRDPDRLAAMRRDAYDLLVAELPMRGAADTLLEHAAALRAAPARGRPGPPPPPAPPEPEPAPDPLRAVVKRLTVEAIELRRRVAALERAVAGDPEPGAVRREHETPAYAAARPRVTVCVPCFDAAATVAATIAGVAAQEHGDLELLVLDDASRDDSRAVVRRALDARPWLPAALLARSVNGGVARARNALAEAARGEHVLMLDADNELWPPAVARLVAALDADTGALFAYPVLQVHVDGEPDALLSYRAWDPRLLARHNVVDALALLRRDRLLALGGYRDDVRMYGWEDYDLWARAAERGEHGVHVPEVLARYRRGTGTMLSITEIDRSAMLALLRERYPRTMAGAPGP
jgi:hypothetical protein